MTIFTIAADSKKTANPHSSRSKSTRYAALATLGGILGFIALWKLAAVITDNAYVIPQPHAVFARLYDMIISGELISPTAHSFLTIMKGYLIGTLVGTVMGIISANRIGGAFFSPFSTVIKATPVASLILLSYFWLKTENVPTFIAALMVTPIVWQATQTAIRLLDDKMLIMCRYYHLSLPRTIRLYILPQITPSCVSSFLTSIGLAFKAGIAAEVICHPKNTLGLALYNSKTYLETTDMYALTLVVILLSVTIEMILRLLIRRIVTKGKNK